jgi:circadian clock protein KaiC
MEKEIRCASGIQGFDKLCEGGFIDDSINLVMGNPGSGKTTFSLQFLYNGATKFNESGLYITFENDVEDLKRVGKKLGMDFEKTQKKNATVSFLRYDFKRNIKSIQNELVKLIAEHDIKRICLDPINIFTLEFDKGINIRRELYDFLSLLRRLDLCVVISGETDENVGGDDLILTEEISFCKYLADGVIQLYSSGLSGSGDRALRITKMRMTNHQRGPVGMQLTAAGVKILKS